MCISAGRLHFYRNNIMTRSHRSLPNQKIFLFITVWLLTECTFSRFNFVQIYTFSRFNANHLAKFSHIIHTSSITFHSPPLCYLFCRWGHGISNRCRCYCWFCPRYFSNRQDLMIEDKISITPFISKLGLFSGFYLWKSPNRILNLWE